jgi:hypothetical protein
MRTIATPVWRQRDTGLAGFLPLDDISDVAR